MSVIQQYERQMRRRNLRPGTIYKRLCELRMWLEYVADEWSTATPDHVEDWIDSRDPLAACTRYATISHLHCFYEWARMRRLVEVDPTEMVERPRLSRSLPRPMRVDVVDQLIEAADDHMAAMLALMADSGLRCCEVAALDWADVDLIAGTIHVVGKGGHERVVGIPARLRLRLYVIDEGSGPVPGRQMSPARVSQLVGQFIRSQGVDGTAHRLRHTYATRLYRALDGDLLALQHALGHASVTTTQIYAAIDPERALRVAQTLT